MLNDWLANKLRPMFAQRTLPITEVIMLAADEYRRLKGEVTGPALIEMLQASPHRDVEIARPRAPAPIRDVNL